MPFTKHFRRLSFRFHIIPVVVWLAAIICVIVLVNSRTQKFTTTGIVYGQQKQILAVAAGRIKSIKTDLYNEVHKGQVLVEIDTVLSPAKLVSDLNARRDVFLARIQQLQAQLSALRDELSSEGEQEKNNWSADARRFSTNVDSAKLHVMELKATIAPAKIKLDEIQLNIKMARAGAFIDPNVNKIQSHYQIEQLKIQADALTKEIEENEELLKQAEENLLQAEQRWEEFKKSQPQQRSIEIALQPLREEINVNQKEIEQLEILANQPDISIESPFDGIVTNIAYKTGETVLEEQPILTIVEKTPTYIIAYISEEQYGMLQERMKVRIIKRSYPEQIAMSFVEKLVPSVQMLPERLWIDNRTPQWGRPVLIPIPAGLSVIPGEEVMITSI